MKKLFLAGLLIFPGILQAMPSCDSPAAAQFDFWIGNWKLTWNDSLEGTNRIQKELNSCVVTESFVNPKQQFAGRSWSVYDDAAKCWKQTWVDNQGSYIVLTGRWEDNKMTLWTEPSKNATGKSIQKRMVFYNITGNQFDWNWEFSNDDGKTWQASWVIHYQRMQD